LNADFGVMISASHNSFEDNGIKLFHGSGDKLTDEQESRIEALLDEPVVTSKSSDLGQAKRLDNARTDYEWFARSTVPAETDFSAIKVVLDCAHGAGYKVAPRTLGELGADVIPVGCSPNGRNINMKCGSTEPDLLRATVKGLAADVGIALDGDGDRVVMVDELGNLVDGDQLIFILAVYAQSQGALHGPVVGTVMSNLGLELTLQERGVKFLRAAVGDRNVLAMLKEKGGELGGETSGHVIDLSTSTTGDGLVTALRVLHVMTATGNPLSALAGEMPKFPQVMINVSADRDLDLTSAREVVEAVARVEERMAGRGRVVLRASGTEPVIRVMVEGENAVAVNDAAEEIATRVREVAGSH